MAQTSDKALPHRPHTRITLFNAHTIFFFKASVFYSQKGKTMVNAKACVCGALRFRIGVSILGLWCGWRWNHLAQACRNTHMNLQIHARKSPCCKYALSSSLLFTFCLLFHSLHMAVTLSSSLWSICCHRPFRWQIFWAVCGSVSLLFNTAN